MDLQIVSNINQSLDTAFQASTLEDLQLKLTTHINYLLLHDFEKLISILYRIDVSENKLRRCSQHYCCAYYRKTIAENGKQKKQ